MTSYQKLRKDRDLLSKEFKHLREACMAYLAMCRPDTDKHYHVIANAIYEVGKMMTHETEEKKN